MMNKQQLEEQIRTARETILVIQTKNYFENEAFKKELIKLHNEIKVKLEQLKEMQIDFSTLEVDTLCKTDVGLRYFSHIYSFDKVCFFDSGRNSKTSEGYFYHCLNYNVEEVIERPKKPWVPISEFTDGDLRDMRAIEFRGIPKSIALLGSNVGEIDVELNYVTHFRKTNEDN